MALLLFKHTSRSQFLSNRLVTNLGVCWRQASASSSSEEEENRGTESETINFDSKEYRSWVEDALKGLRSDAKLEKADAGASRELPSGDTQSMALSSSADGKALQSSRHTDSIMEQPLAAEARGAQLAENSEAQIQAGLKEEPLEPVLEEPSLEEPSLEEPEENAVQRRLTVREDEDLLQGLPIPGTGYREIASRSFRSRHAEDLQISQGQRFRPGDLYEPEDLVARTRNWEEKPWLKAYKQTKKATNPVALRETDFRNVSFLHKFTSEAGNIPARRVTRLQKKVHTHVMRSIKTARTMGLLPRLGKVPELMPPFRNQK